jgi:hypothetical protein
MLGSSRKLIYGLAMLYFLAFLRLVVVPLASRTTSTQEQQLFLHPPPTINRIQLDHVEANCKYIKKQLVDLIDL